MRPIALLAVLPVAIVCAAPASASYPGRDGELAAVWNQFDRGGDSDFELRLVTPTGTVLRRVAACSRPEPSYEPPSGECPHDPAFSSQADRLAYELDGRLVVAGADGSGAIALPRLTGHDSEPACRPAARGWCSPACGPAGATSTS